jgi:hypothetical protein
MNYVDGTYDRLKGIELLAHLSIDMRIILKRLLKEMNENA